MNAPSPSEWSWREDFFLLAHRWYLWFALFLAGCAGGWIIAKLLPAPYRAEADLGVFYQSDAIFRNVDDYKNWEMGQLQALILSDHLLSVVKAQLSEQDPVWQTLTPADLRERLHVYWRNAGVWHLVAEDYQPQRAVQLVTVWKAIILEEMGRITELTHQLKQIELELKALAQAKAAAEQRLVELEAMRSLLQNWQAGSDAVLAEKPLPPLQRWRLLELALRVDENRLGKSTLAASFPDEEAHAAAYQPWLEQASTVIATQTELLQAQLPALETKIGEMTTKYNEVAAASWYLSLYLGVDGLNTQIRGPTPVRSESLMALVGGVSTFLTGLLIAFARLQWRKETLVRA